MAALTVELGLQLEEAFNRRACKALLLPLAEVGAQLDASEWRLTDGLVGILCRPLPMLAQHQLFTRLKTAMRYLLPPTHTADSR